MDYKQTLDYLYAQLPMFTRVGAVAIKKDLGNTLALCSVLGNPHKKFKSVHIAGTNGKGSVAHILASVLQSAGYKVGLYTSPHLKDFRERIKINGELIPQQEVINFVEHHKTEFEEIKPSFFEMTVALCFDYFAKQQVDIAIVETGLGGRLDSTNIITPLLSVITNIGYDHMDMLGDTLPLIAGEKAGIIKPQTPVVIGETNAETKNVFTEKAKAQNASITFADSEYTIANYTNKEDVVNFTITNTTQTSSETLNCDVTGIYQKQNIITAYTAIQKLKTLNFTISSQALQQGFANIKTNTGLMGRWQKLSASPLTYTDTGHNIDGVTQVLLQLKQQQYNQLHIVWGMVKDKDISKILSILPKNATYYFCQAQIPRALKVDTLHHEATKHQLKGNTHPSVAQALQTAQKAAKSQDLVFVGGSTFVVAEVV